MEKRQPQRLARGEFGPPTQPQQQGTNCFDRHRYDEDIQCKIGNAAEPPPVAREGELLVGAERLLDYKTFIQSNLPSYQTEEEYAEGDKAYAAHLKQDQDHNLSKTTEICGSGANAQARDGNCARRCEQRLDP